MFDRHDVAKALHRYIDEPEAFQAAFAKVMASPALVELDPEKSDGPGGGDPRSSPGGALFDPRNGRYRARPGGRRHAHGRGAAPWRRSEPSGGGACRSGCGDPAGRGGGFLGRIARGELSEAEGQAQVSAAGLSDEQRGAIEHIAGSEQIAAVVGFAGAGKSTMLAAAREAWQAQGYTVHGAALSGKAAEGLEESSGIQSRTLASWDYGWQAGRGELGPKDVLVIDEAGMVGSRQLARFVGEAERTGAKLVLVGDHEQLQAIGAGAPFRAIAERVGFASLQDIRRQREDWQRGASADFARHRTGEGLASYAERGAVTFSDTRDAARGAIVQDYMRDLEQRPEGSRVAMAHRRVDVRALNEDIRAARQERGELARGAQGLGADAGERVFETNDGKRSFAAGDRIVFLGKQSRPWREERHAGDRGGRRGRADHCAARRQGPGRRGAHGDGLDGGLRGDRSRLRHDDPQDAGRNG